MTARRSRILLVTVVVTIMDVSRSCRLREAMFMNLTMTDETAPDVRIEDVGEQCDEEIRVATSSHFSVPLFLLRYLGRSDQSGSLFWGTIPQARHLIRHELVEIDGAGCTPADSLSALVEFEHDVYVLPTTDDARLRSAASGVLKTGTVTSNGLGYPTLFEVGAGRVSTVITETRSAGVELVEMSQTSKTRENTSSPESSRSPPVLHDLLFRLGWRCRRNIMALRVLRAWRQFVLCASSVSWSVLSVLGIAATTIVLRACVLRATSERPNSRRYPGPTIAVVRVIMDSTGRRYARHVAHRSTSSQPVHD